MSDYKPELTTAPKHGHKSLLYSEVVSDLNTLDSVDIAVLGIPYGSPYSIDEVTNDQTNAPTAVRQASDRAVRSIEQGGNFVVAAAFQNVESKQGHGCSCRQ